MRHHYVPQFLLRSWADLAGDGKVEVYRLDLESVCSSRRGPRYTGYENDLYALSMPVVAGMEQQAIEKRLLRRIDTQGAAVLQKLLNHGLHSLSLDQRMDWARFIMSLRLRQPTNMTLLRSESASHLRDTLATQPEQYEQLARVGDPPSFEEWVEHNFPGLIENCGLSFFSGLVNNSRIGLKVLQTKWWIWDFAGLPFELLLGDNPCIFTSGIDSPNLLIALPLSPYKAFLTTSSERTERILEQQPPRELAMRLNESTLAQAHARIYAKSASPRRFIENRLSRRQGRRT